MKAPSLALRRRSLLILLALWLPQAFPALQRQAATTLNLPAELPSPTGYTTVNAIPITGVPAGMTFTNPMCTAFPAGETNRLYVALRAGSVRVVNNLSSATPSQAIFMDLAAYLTTQGITLPLGDENGLLSMVFHPDYNQNGYFYLYFSITISSQLHQRLARFQATGTPGNYNAATSADPATQTPLLTIYDQAGNHNGGDLAFGADGYLYISLGDEGGGGDVYNNARFINKDFWGQMLRLDVDSRPDNLLPNAHSQAASTSHPSAVHAGSYRVPADNPFIGATTWHGQTFSADTVRTEIYATGFRNPFRFSIDAPTGRIFLGDVGQSEWEEVDLVIKGGDYGWSWREGFHPYFVNTLNPPRFPDNSPGTTNAPPASGFDPIDPIFEYISETGGSGTIYGTSVCGGMVYRGSQLPELHGAYIFGDVFGGGGIIAALRETSPGVWTAQALTTRPQIVDYGIDPRNGELLLCSLQGTIYRLTSSGTTGTEPPNLLSATGAFSSLTTLTPSTGVVPYEPNVSFWSDGAIKSRWFAIRNGSDTMTLSGAGNWTFPTRMVWVKHFNFDTPAGTRKLETRFLVKTTGGVYGLSYKWREDQTDAELVPPAGETFAIPGASPAQSWRFPSRGDCMICHTQTAGFALSFNTPQLNRSHLYAGDVQNQILALSAAGYLSAPVSSVAEFPAFAPATDESQSLEWRVRSYLAVNCVQCHQPNGGGQGSWDARHTTPTDMANLINGTLVAPFHADNRFVVPQRPDLSMLLKRQRGDGVNRMPPLATIIRDEDNENLVEAWINSLGSRQSLAEWQTAHFGAPSAADAQPTNDPDGDGLTNYFEYLAGTHPTAAGSTWTFGQSGVSGGHAQIQFLQPANRGAIIEVSPDLLNWQPWNAPGNGPSFLAGDSLRTISAPVSGPDRYFRVRFVAP